MPSTAEVLLKATIKLLELCQTCTTRLLEPKLACGYGQTQFDIKFDASLLCEVRFTKTHLHRVTVQDCDWKNVTFTDCKLSNVNFDNVRLENVHFHGIDFDKVTLQDVTIEDLRWSGDNKLAMAHISRVDSLGSLKVARAIPLQWVGAAQSAPTSPSPAASRDMPLEDSRLIINWCKPRLPDLPDRVLQKIASLLLPGRMIKFGAFDDFLTGNVGVQTTYYNTLTRKRATYMAGPKFAQYEYTKNFFSDHEPLNLNIGFLTTNRRIFEIAAEVLYSRCLSFNNEAESCLAFLHDHRAWEYSLKDIEVIYDRNTDPRGWQYLFNALVHERVDLETLRMRLGASFWEDAPWEAGVDAVVRWRGWNSRQSLNVKTFIEHISRLPFVPTGRRVPASRRNIVKLMFHIACDGPRTFEMTAFEQELGDYIRESSYHQRRWEVPTNERYGRCEGKFLEASCYWDNARACDEHCDEADEQPQIAQNLYY